MILRELFSVILKPGKQNTVLHVDLVQMKKSWYVKFLAILCVQVSFHEQFNNVHSCKEWVQQDHLYEF